MKNRMHWSTVLPLLDGLIASLKRVKFPMWFGGSKSSWVQNGIDKDSVDLESGRGCLVPHSVKPLWYHSEWNFPTQKFSVLISGCNFFISVKIVQSPRKNKNGGEGGHSSWSYSTSYYFVRLPYHRSRNWNLSRREEDAGQKLEGFLEWESRLKIFCILVEICQIRLRTGLKNPYPCPFL